MAAIGANGLARPLKPSFSSTWSEPALLGEGARRDQLVLARCGARHRSARAPPRSSALAPVGLAQPIAELGRPVLEEGEADDADELAVERDGIGPLVGPLREDLDEADGIGPGVGAGQARQLFGDRLVVGERARGRARRRASARAAPAAWSRSCRAACRGPAQRQPVRGGELGASGRCRPAGRRPLPRRRA